MSLPITDMQVLLSNHPGPHASRLRTCRGEQDLREGLHPLPRKTKAGTKTKTEAGVKAGGLGMRRERTTTREVDLRRLPGCTWPGSRQVRLSLLDVKVCVGKAPTCVTNEVRQLSTGITHSSSLRSGKSPKPTSQTSQKRWNTVDVIFFSNLPKQSSSLRQAPSSGIRRLYRTPSGPASSKCSLPLPRCG